MDSSNSTLILAVAFLGSRVACCQVGLESSTEANLLWFAGRDVAEEILNRETSEIHVVVSETAGHRLNLLGVSS